MSVAAVAWAFEQTLPPNEKVVLLSLADCENGQTALCIPGQEKLAEMSSMSVRSVQRMLAKLEERGLIRREHRTSQMTGYRTSDSYVLALRDNLSGRPEPTRQIGQANTTTVSGIREPEVEPEDTPPTPSDEDRVFDSAWAHWPKKVGKAAARKAWAKAAKIHMQSVQAGEIPDAPDWLAMAPPDNALANSVVRFGAAYQRTTPPQFIPHLSTWLNQERWTDAMPVSRDRGAHQPEPAPAPRGMILPPGHRWVRDENWNIIGTEPIPREEGGR